MRGEPQTFSSGKIYWKKYWEKIDTDIINWEKLFDRSGDDTYKAIYRYSLTSSMKTYTNRNNM